VDLEVKVAADRLSVAGLAHGSDPLPGVDAVALLDRRRPGHVGVEVGAVLSFAVDEEVVAIEDRIEAAVKDPAAADSDQRRAARGDDVEALMGATAAARGAEFADVATRRVRPLNGKDVVAIGEAAVAGSAVGESGCDDGREQEEDRKSEALQWCSMTRSTRLYSFASSALMK
jgi:hypothetical protein